MICFHIEFFQILLLQCIQFQSSDDFSTNLTKLKNQESFVQTNNWHHIEQNGTIGISQYCVPLHRKMYPSSGHVKGKSLMGEIFTIVFIIWSEHSFKLLHYHIIMEIFPPSFQPTHYPSSGGNIFSISDWMTSYHVPYDLSNKRVKQWHANIWCILS